MAIAIILAAGGSRRMGAPKALLSIGEKCLIEAHIEVLFEHCSRVIVVGGALRQPLEKICRRTDAQFVHNLAWETTMPIDSLRCVLALNLPGPWVVTPVDAPPVLVGDLGNLVNCKTSAVLAHQGRSGHPVLLAQSEIARLPKALHLREILTGSKQVSSQNPDCLLNINHPEQWASWLDSYLGRAKKTP